MTRIVIGVIAGVLFGLLVVAVMLPMELPNRDAALIAAFLNRFAIGFLTATVALPFPAWARGLLVALLISLPEAIVTDAYFSALGTGLVGGLVTGIVVGWLERRLAGFHR